MLATRQRLRMAGRVAGRALDPAERLPAEQALQRGAIVGRDDLEAGLRVRACADEVAGLHPRDRKTVLGAFGLQPGAGDGPVKARGLRGHDHQCTLVVGARELLLERAGELVAGDRECAVHRVGRRQARASGQIERFAQQRAGARRVALGQAGRCHRDDADAVGGRQSIERHALAAGEPQARDAAHAGLAACALGHERRQRTQPLDEGNALRPLAEVLAVHMLAKVHQLIQLRLVDDERHAVIEAAGDLGSVGRVIVPGLVDEGLEVHVGSS